MRERIRKARELAPARWKVQLGGPIGGALGPVGTSATVLVGGEPGAGKSTESFRAVAAMRAGFVSLEMGPELAGATAARAAAGEVEVVFSVGDGLALCESGRWQACVVDSLGEGEPSYELFRQFEAACVAGRCVLLGVVHATREGAIYGPAALLHKCDAVVWVTSEAVEVRGKNRFGPPRRVERG